MNWAGFVKGVLVGATLLCGGCTPPSLKYPTRSVSPQVFRQTIRTLAYAPLLTSNEDATQEFVGTVGGNLARELKGLGVTLMRPDAWNACWFPAVEAAGGLFDPKTGQFDEQKEAKLRWKCTQQVTQSLGADGVIEIDVIVVSAPLSEDVVRWHGVEEDTRSFGARFWSGGTYSGQLPALSLTVRIQDRNGRSLFENAGGLEVVGQVEGGAVQTKPKLLRDKEKIALATRVAMRPLSTPSENE